MVDPLYSTYTTIPHLLACLTTCLDLLLSCSLIGFGEPAHLSPTLPKVIHLDPASYFLVTPSFEIDFHALRDRPQTCILFPLQYCFSPFLFYMTSPTLNCDGFIRS